MSRLSATTAFAPPGPRSLAAVVSRWRRSLGRSFMAGKGRDACVQEQDCLSDQFRVTITNSPPTRVIVVLFRKEPFRQELTCFMDWYNRNRPHSTLDGKDLVDQDTEGHRSCFRRVSPSTAQLGYRTRKLPR